METVTRKKRLTAVFKHPLTEVMQMLLHTALPPPMNLILLLQRSDPLIHILYDALLTCVKNLWSRFVSPELVRKFAKGDVTISQNKGKLIKNKNISDKK